MAPENHPVDGGKNRWRSSRFVTSFPWIKTACTWASLWLDPHLPAQVTSARKCVSLPSCCYKYTYSHWAIPATSNDGQADFGATRPLSSSPLKFHRGQYIFPQMHFVIQNTQHIQKILYVSARRRLPQGVTVTKVQEHAGYEQHKILLGCWPVTARPLNLTEPFGKIWLRR